MRAIIVTVAVLMAVTAMAQEEGVLTGEWELITDSAQWGIRDTAEPFVLDGRLWLSNGYYNGNVLYPDLWSSKNGRHWRMDIEKTPYWAYAEMVVYNGRVYAVKGDVWVSDEGKNWERILEQTPFGVRGYGETLVHSGKIYQLGSGDDVWASTDGINWECIADGLPYGERYGSAVASFDGKLWLMGGRIPVPNDPPEAHYKDWTSCNDVWSSEDGVTWERVVEHAPWIPRVWFVAESYRDRLWIIGGFDNVNQANFAEIWYTDDGVTWHQMPTPEGFQPRHEPTTWVFEDSLWIAGGNNWPLLNDVWRLTVPAEE